MTPTPPLTAPTPQELLGIAETIATACRKDVARLTALGEIDGTISRVYLTMMANTFDALRAALSAAATDRDRLISALEHIAAPVSWLQADAKRQGMGVNGGALVALANDAAYLSRVAHAALSAARAPREENDG